jgi:hypothetical protein
MKQLLAMVTMLATATAFAETIHFDDAKPGSLPAGWIAGVTGRGTPKWSVEADDSAPSKSQVLKQSGEATFAWCVLKNVALTNGAVQVRFKPVAGKEDQAGGVVWRFQDADNYYVCRANALEDNVTIYHTVNGRRVSFKNVNAKVASGTWHALRVDFAGNRFVVTFDGRRVLEASDDTFQSAGAVGVWTKADSVTEFDDFWYGKESER